ncbi:MAG TPA: ATP-binding cassette domain-containing protein [Thermoguttaceae bacterium]|nr:ATP-binding cassette domain-containing protein [Thermoguttaceae bacterium]
MSLVTLRELSIGFRGPPLLDAVSCRIRRGERIGLLGRNGAGKSTLMRILCGQVEPDGGEVVLAGGATVSLLTQDVPQGVCGAVREVVAAGLPPRETGPESAWREEQQVRRVLSQMELDGAAAFEVLSAGMKRRVLLARALVGDPDLLLLDEPTNHLDIDAIDWLERFLDRWATTLMFVTHDRMFLRKLAGRILELDRGRLFDWCCDYETFLERKETALAAEEKQNALFDKRLAQEEAWIRQGIMARRTRNEGRVRALQQMRNQRRQRRTASGKVRMELRQELRSGNLVADARGVSFAYGDNTIIRDFSTTIMRRDKIGIIGPNGAGKTTLLRVLLGQLSPTQGSVRLGTNLQIAYFDQLRAQLAEDRTVQENVADGYDSVRVGGKTKHIIGYLQEFLFTPERARTPIRFLSGGERNRVLLARLFAKPANVVVLDEPTNDLDTETLELLEELLVEYEGTVLLVSHDRAFLDNVVTSTIVFEGDSVKEYVGGYDDWLRQRQEATLDALDTLEAAKGGTSRVREKPASSSAESAPKTRDRRLTYKEKQELAALPATIERLEADIAGLHELMSAPEFYKRPGNEIARQTATLRRVEDQLAEAYHRWEELEKPAD